MLKTYEIAGIKIAFAYRFDRFFKNNIERYEVEDVIPDHEIKVVYESPITLRENSLYRVFSKNVYGIKSMMVYSEDYKHIEIIIDEKAFSDLETAEYIYSGMVFLEIAELHGLLPLHSSAISYNEEAILFSAPSGTGKSTHARLWKDYLKDQVDWINDDKPLIKLEDGKIFIYGGPFSGHYVQNQNKKYPLKAIVFLDQGSTDEVKLLNEKEALQHMITNILRPTSEAIWDKMLEVIEEVIKRIPMYHLDATMTLDAVTSIKKAIYGE